MPTVRVALHLPGITTGFVDVEFLVDTGATDSCLHPLDALAKLMIERSTVMDRSLWSMTCAIGGIGGRDDYYAHEAVYAFTHDDGSEQRLTRDISIARPNAANARLPSLLGMDMLRLFTLHMDYTGRRLTLES